jgi:hypothetical protein
MTEPGYRRATSAQLSLVPSSGGHGPDIARGPSC